MIQTKVEAALKKGKQKHLESEKYNEDKKHQIKYSRTEASKFKEVSSYLGVSRDSLIRQSILVTRFYYSDEISRSWLVEQVKKLQQGVEENEAAMSQELSLEYRDEKALEEMALMDCISGCVSFGLNILHKQNIVDKLSLEELKEFYNSDEPS
ncbi:hypothetical protein NEA10_11455 [Phormidium yuhuli AB48]|uniref:Uncharacterized protein n=1 Tax=Phormidium yuhuli AB48 TaxID=2940671 RepID=A0ABY5AKP2_9CYAN|nr:hypothetical protein [Phormidium yuhuli]USR89506.1 hypothetical protein NEA10_11455 [Phormidium yuhuli AB48]